MIEVRPETPDDVASIREVNTRAFGQEQEANIVDALRANGAAAVSLVATLDGRVVGHILYSPVTLGDRIRGAALGPMAVLPDCQRQGIGVRLVEAGNRRIEEEGYPFIAVVGHAEYYPKFGFRPASRAGMRCEWDVPDDVFMVLVLDPARMRGVSGMVKYRDEFSTVV